VFQLHGGLLSALCSTKLSKLLVRRLLSIPNAVVVLARVEKRDFNQLGIVKHLVVIPNGVDVNKYRGSEPRIHSGRIQHLAYMGRLMREKGIFEAIEAVEILRKEPQFSNIELKIAGSGPARAEIERYICEHALDRHVKLVGSLFGADKIHFLREADLFVFSSYHQEGLPYSILESLAAGTPVVASNVAGIPDVLSDGIHGILIKPGNADEIVRAVRTLVCSHDLRAMSLDCQDWASRELGLERLATDFEKLYESIQV
jgi:glycosyltransferase involved in cell wall biosynthesis